MPIKEIACFAASTFLLSLASLTDAQQSRMHVQTNVNLQIIESVEVPATANGPITAILFKNGETVQPGDQLARILDVEFQNKLKQARIELEIVDAKLDSQVEVEFAQKSLKVAETDLIRARESNNKFAGVVSDREMDRLRLLVEQSKAELKKVQFEHDLLALDRKLKQAIVEQFEFETNRHQIISNIAGRIIEINKQPGEWVNIAEPVFTIVNLNSLKVECYIPHSTVSEFETGSPVRFTPTERNQNTPTNFEGHITFISPEINPLNGTVKIWAEFDNKRRHLRPGMKGSLEFLAASISRKK